MIPQAHLEDWVIINFNADAAVAMGRVSGHDRIADGSGVTTSLIQHYHHDEDDNLIGVSTYNTYYTLGNKRA